MFNSRHIYIRHGALSFNDNGAKKFNKSDIRYRDELLLEFVSDINRSLNDLKKGRYLLYVPSNRKEIVLDYTQISFIEDIVRTVILDEQDEREKAIEGRTDETDALFAGSADEIIDYNLPSDVICLCHNKPFQLINSVSKGYLPQVEEILEHGVLGKIKAINDQLQTIDEKSKVVIYGGGYQTDNFLKYANSSRLFITHIVDMKEAMVFDYKSEKPSREILSEADVIIITPFFAERQIRKYLEELGVTARIISLRELSGDLLFTGHENIWAPDKKKLKYESEIAGKDINDKLLEAIETVRNEHYCAVTVKKNCRYHSKADISDAQKTFYRDVAIVVQGPLVVDDDFTLDTVLLYKDYFPNSKIIVSVWEDEKGTSSWNPNITEGIDIVYSKRPELPGYQNTNMQLTTSYAGIKRAKECGYKYAMKLRSDMRFYSPDLLRYMYFFMKQIKANPMGVQKERLVIFPPRYEYFFFFCDFFMFGNIDDMLNYWNSEDLFSNEYVGESAEVMIAQRYARKTGIYIENDLSNLKQYKEVLLNNFAIVDDKSLHYIWKKYFYHKQWEHEYHYNIMNNVDWLAGQEFVL